MLFSLAVRGDASTNSAQGTQSVSNHLMHALRYIRYGSIPHHERMYPVLSLPKHQGERLGTK